MADSQNAEPVRPFCKVCGWRKGGIDSWDGAACKCGLTEPPIPPVAEIIALPSRGGGRAALAKARGESQ